MDQTGTAGLTMFSVGQNVEVCFDREVMRDCWFPATVLKILDSKTFIVEHRPPESSDEAVFPNKCKVDYLEIRPSPPHLRDKNFVLLEMVDAYCDPFWRIGVITKELADNRYNVFVKHIGKEMEFPYLRVRPHMEWKNGKWFNTSQGDTDGRTSSTDKQPTVAASKLNKTTQENLDSNDKVSPHLRKLQDEIRNFFLSKETNRSSVGQSELSESEVSGMADQAFGKTENLSHGKKVCAKLLVEWEMLTDHLKNLQAAGKGPKEDSITVRTGEVLGKDDMAAHCAFLVVMDEHFKRMKESHMLQKGSIEKSPKFTGSDDAKRPAVPYSSLTVAEKGGSEGDSASVALKRKRGRPDGQTKEVGLTTSLATKSLKEKHGTVKEQLGIQNASLRKDRLSSENTGQDIDVHLGQEAKKYDAKKGKWMTISVNTNPAQDASKEKTYGSLEKDLATTNPEACVENLPFVKSTSLWKTIESMEIFRRLPQKPHFRPLLKGVKESACEGLAIGTMVTFSTIADKTRGLRFTDPKSTIEDYLETLAELENNGFDVKVIRDRLTQLLMIKDKQEHLTEQSKRAVETIEEHNVKVKRVDEEIEAFDRQIRELEDKRENVLLKKKNMNTEIGVVKAKNVQIEQQLSGVDAEFDGLAAAPF